MVSNKHLAVVAAVAGFAFASPAPQQLDFAALETAPAVASGPSALDEDGIQSATLFTSFTLTAATTAPATTSVATTPAAQRRDLTERDCASPSAIETSAYTPYYPALATSYTTDPALTATTTAGQACPTTPEDGTYCGFINPEDPCAPQPDGYGPVPTSDTDSDFLAFSSLHSLAQAAPTKIPSTECTEYTQVFKDLDGSVSAQSYMGLYTLDSYDPALCAAKCDAAELCTSFNIYAERDPSLNPSANDSTAATVWGYWCPNPPSMTSFKCTLWGSNIDASVATNMGQYREQFHVVITASNGYDKTDVTIPPEVTQNITTSAVPSTTSSSSSSSSSSSTSTSTTPATTTAKSSTLTTKTSTTSTSTKALTTSTAKPGHPWSKPTNCNGKAINASKYFLGARFFPGPFNPQVCSDYALAQNALNKAKGVTQQCQMFNAYYLNKNGVPYGTYCGLYNSRLDTSFATYKGGKAGRDAYECRHSWTYSLL
ncbi:hypothetical protein KC363_g7670 [Hortaea werneckii]|uniref:Apple domain-containing protein n=1 Tax=Hortaea werneckii TaxID=91943 RepID=A0A3M7F6V9_HORWE|nr:hypothetical protein KC363_g7670 [Hortaea werneckii]RMY84513.1 hypothetical protein D0861_06911 [Hortaea werneckii]